MVLKWLLFYPYITGLHMIFQHPSLLKMSVSNLSLSLPNTSWFPENLILFSTDPCKCKTEKNPFSSTPAIYRNAKQKRPAKKKNTAAAGKIKFNGIFSREYLSFCQHVTRNKTKKAIAKASIRKNAVSFFMLYPYF